jgi:death on curing protein
MLLFRHGRVSTRLISGRGVLPDPVERAAILASRIVRNHPLPDGNKRTALLCMLIALDEAGYYLGASQDDRAEAIERLAGAEPPLSEPDFVAWVKANVAQAHDG